MTQYDKLVHDTAEKMAAISYTYFGTASKTLQDHWTMTMYPSAELAVAMKADGVMLGISIHEAAGHWDKPKEYIAETVQSLGLTKPTDNDN